MSATQSNLDSERPNRRRHRATLVVLVLLVLPALALCCAVGALQTRGDDPPLADYTLGPISLHSAPGYVTCLPTSPTPCFSRWYIIRVSVLLPTRETWGFDIWAPFVDSHAGVTSISCNVLPCRAIRQTFPFKTSFQSGRLSFTVLIKERTREGYPL